MSDPVALAKLDPATLAKHLANPEGTVGIAVTAGLNRSNASLYTAVLSKLAVQTHERILEIGFGNGHEINRLLSCAPGLVYTGSTSRRRWSPRLLCETPCRSKMVT
jgi:hypothetical protein